MIVSAGLVAKLKGVSGKPSTFAHETKEVERIALGAVMQAEKGLGFVPKNISNEKRGYDIESAMPGTGRLRFIEVKGRAKDASTVTITKNEILTGLNKPDDFILAIVEVDGVNGIPKYVVRPFQREPDFGVTSVNYDLRELLAKATDPI
jgi:hypothetical protein